jgi:hypothetical protein
MPLSTGPGLAVALAGLAMAGGLVHARARKVVVLVHARARKKEAQTLATSWRTRGRKNL